MEETASPEVLLEQWINLEGAEKTEWYTTPGSLHKGITETHNTLNSNDIKSI